MTSLSLAAVEERIAQAKSVQDIEELRVALLGKKGELTSALRALAEMPPEQRRAEGAKLNALKEQIQVALTAKRTQLEGAQDSPASTQAGDISFGKHSPQGSLHPLTKASEDLQNIFAQLGFSVATGPEIETEFYNFTALNIPAFHPARQMHDTFYFPANAQEERLLLRTHTSPVQIRTMEKQKPPLRLIAPGRVYRCDSDQTHTPMFHQIEGLVVDKDIHLGHLRWLLEEFLRAFFATDKMELRFRPSYFPFTEPSFEVDMRYTRHPDGRLELGAGEQWMEILGCGMVHTEVFRACKLDPSEWTGFAFGVGIDRLAMLQNGIGDLRQFFEGDVRWLNHYGAGI